MTELFFLASMHLIRICVGCIENCNSTVLYCVVNRTCNEQLSPSNDDKQYPAPPQDVRVTAILDKNTKPVPSISWTYDTSKPRPQHFGVRSRLMKNPNAQACIQYNLGDQQTPASRFFHNCSNSSSYYYELFSLPRQDQDVDYIHRIVQVEEDYKDDPNNTYLWLPPVMEIYNDSCQSRACLTFRVPQFVHSIENIAVRIYIRDHMLDSTPKALNSSDGRTTFCFANLSTPSSDYTIKFLLNSNENIDIASDSKSCGCKKKGKCANCAPIETEKFLINASHPKCFISVPRENRSAPVVPLISIVVISLLIIIIGILRIWWCIKNCSKKFELQPLGSLHGSVVGSGLTDFSPYMPGRSVSEMLLWRGHASTREPTICQVLAAKKQRSWRMAFSEPDLSHSYHSADVINGTEDASVRLASHGYPLSRAANAESDATSTVVTGYRYDTDTQASWALGQDHTNTPDTNANESSMVDYAPSYHGAASNSSENSELPENFEPTFPRGNMTSVFS